MQGARRIITQSRNSRATIADRTRMTIKRSAVIAVVGGACVAWLSSAMTPVAQPTPFGAARAKPIERSGAELAQEIERLHERLRPDVSPSQPGRNLFAFRTAPALHADAPPPVVAAPTAPAPPAQPTLKLSGIAEDANESGATRTAIIAGDGQLYLVKEGEAVGTRYRVTRISPDVVELTDVANGTTRRLALP